MKVDFVVFRSLMFRVRSSLGGRGVGFFVVALSMAVMVGGCDVFNPAFVDLVDTTGMTASLENAPGHVVVQFINNAEVDEQLITYLEGQGLELTPAERRGLRPRVRMRVQITFTSGIATTVEFVSGSTKLIDPQDDPRLFPDLIQNELDNAVVLCEVSRVEVLPNTVEVFIPSRIQEWELVTTSQFATPTFQRRDVIPARFRALLLDDVDADGNTTLQRNIPIRRQSTPADNPFCGSVIAIEMTGALSVPFLNQPRDDLGLAPVDTNPSFQRGNAQQQASIGGRFEFSVTFN